MAESRVTPSDDWQGGRTLGEACAYMFTNSIDTDIEFSVGSSHTRVGAHRFILVCRSSVFQAMLCSDFADSKEVIHIPDIEPDIFTTFLQFLYTDDNVVTADNVLGILYTAKKYGVHSLVTQCLGFLSDSRSVENICSILQQAHLYDEQSFKQESLKYILDNGQETLPTAGFLDLCRECVQLIAGDDALCSDEVTVFQAVSKWADHQCGKGNLEITTENLRKVLADVFACIRFPLLGETYFTDVASDSALLTDAEKVSLFKYFFKKGDKPETGFISRPRSGKETEEAKGLEDVYTTDQGLNEATILTCERFSRVFEEDSWCSGEEEDAVTFSVSASIVLHGVLVYGVYIGEASYEAEFVVYDCNDVQMVSISCRVQTSEHQLTYPLLLQSPVGVVPDRKYTVAVRMRHGEGKDTYQGLDGRPVVRQSGIKFTFSKSRRSRNGTDEKMGQIPGLLFSKV